MSGRGHVRFVTNCISASETVALYGVRVVALRIARWIGWGGRRGRRVDAVKLGNSMWKQLC